MYSCKQFFLLKKTKNTDFRQLVYQHVAALRN